MLDYEWSNPANMMLSAGGDDQPNNDNDNDNDDNHHHHPIVDLSHQTRQTIYDDHNNQHNHNHYVSPHSQFNDDPNNLISQTLFNHPNPNPHHHHQVNSYFDPRAYPTSYANHPSVLSLDAVPSAASSYFLVPKTEDVTTRSHSDFTSRIGLNLGLGGRTYFSSAEDDFVNRLYRRSRPVEPGGPSNAPRCQAEGCNADLTHAKHYHRRHKVCEFHSKASTVIAAGLTQRFCQQCSRFHLLSEFDNGKRSCRKRLADHNRRRRKSHQTNQENNKSSVQMDNNNALNSSSDNLTRSSPPESGAISSSSVTIGALSPPRMSLDCFKQRPYHQATTSSSASSSSLFFSSG